MAKVKSAIAGKEFGSGLLDVNQFNIAAPIDEEAEEDDIDLSIIEALEMASSEGKQATSEEEKSNEDNYFSDGELDNESESEQEF